MNDNSPLQPGNFGPERPVYPEVEQLLKIVDGTAKVGGVYDCKVQHNNGALAWLDGEDVWGYSLNGTPGYLNGIKIEGRLVGWHDVNGDKRPLYSFVCSCSTTTTTTTTTTTSTTTTSTTTPAP